MEARQTLAEYAKAVEDFFQADLDRVILYGSYARGEQRPDSDIDILVLLDQTDEYVNHHDDGLFDLTYDFNEAHGTDIRPFAKSSTFFRKWQEAHPFYRSIASEGIDLYAKP